MTTTTLEEIEAGIWHFAVEPTPPQMDYLLREIARLQGATIVMAPPPAAADAVTPFPRPEPPAQPAPAEAAPAAPAEAAEAAEAVTAEPEDFLKTCSGCRKAKIASVVSERSAFSRDRATKDTFRYRCRDCTRTQRAIAQRRA
jgi:hypothetical protein